MSNDIIERKEDLQNYLPKLEKGFVTILNKLKNDQGIKGFEMLTDALEGLSWVTSSLELVDSTIINVEDFQDTVETLLDAMENKDVETISDVIEFELLDLVNEWAEKLD
ncbi:hypothetical protein [Candidatus Epulonipiscium viviparus]|uniref:hypothetical protein n=1 Tax=Candidatus Epulonipiscium viviparus TaxID=420336 RepID=UPI0027380405|nr:hypothetical protein [Candidatus Epulopiscium viviparus]